MSGSGWRAVYRAAGGGCIEGGILGGIQLADIRQCGEDGLSQNKDTSRANDSDVIELRGEARNSPSPAILSDRRALSLGQLGDRAPAEYSAKSIHPSIRARTSRHGLRGVRPGIEGSWCGCHRISLASRK